MSPARLSGDMFAILFYSSLIVPMVFFFCLLDAPCRQLHASLRLPDAPNAKHLLPTAAEDRATETRGHTRRQCTHCIIPANASSILRTAAGASRTRAPPAAASSFSSGSEAAPGPPPHLLPPLYRHHSHLHPHSHSRCWTYLCS